MTSEASHDFRRDECYRMLKNIPAWMKFLWSRPPGTRLLPVDLVGAYLVPMVLHGYEIIGYVDRKFVIRHEGVAYISTTFCGPLVSHVTTGASGYIVETIHMQLRHVQPSVSISSTTYAHMIPGGTGIEINFRSLIIHEIVPYKEGAKLEVKSKHEWGFNHMKRNDRILHCAQTPTGHMLVFWRDRELYAWYQDCEPECVLTMDSEPVDVYYDPANIACVLYKGGRVNEYTIKLR